jgi:hypothetical protein
MYQHGSHWMDFREILYWRLLQKSAEKHQISSKSDNNIGSVHVDYSQLYNNAKGTNSCNLVPKFAGSKPAEAVGFFRAKKSSARLPRRGSKSLSHAADLRHVKEPYK